MYSSISLASLRMNSRAKVGTLTQEHPVSEEIIAGGTNQAEVRIFRMTWVSLFYLEKKGKGGGVHLVKQSQSLSTLVSTFKQNFLLLCGCEHQIIICIIVFYIYFGFANHRHIFIKCLQLLTLQFRIFSSKLKGGLWGLIILQGIPIR